MDVTHFEGEITFDNETVVKFAITPEGIISRWGASNEVLGAIVDLTEDVRHALFEHMCLIIEDDEDE
jgi:hypothetical protein